MNEPNSDPSEGQRQIVPRRTGWAWPLPAVLAAAGVMASWTAEAAWWGRAKPREVADQLTNPVAGAHPTASFWSDPEFLKHFMGGYGFQGGIEPKIETTAEAEFQTKTLQPLFATDRERAREALRGYVTQDTNPAFDLMLAKLNLELGDTTNAIKHYEVALAKFPNFRAAHQDMGFALVREQRYAEAVGHLTRTIELGGVNRHTYGLLGLCYFNRNQFISAEAAYKNAMLLDPENKDWKMGVVQCWVQTENFAPAIKLLDEMLQQHPEMANLWSLQAGVYLRMEQLDKAAVSLEMMRRLGKADAKNLLHLGDIYMMQEARELALSAYLEGVEKETDGSREGSLRAAEVLAARSAWEEASALLAKIESAAGAELGEAGKHRLLKLKARVALGQERGGEAMDVLRALAAANPLDGEALLMMGDYELAQDQSAEAENRYKLAMEIDGFEADAMVKLAQLYVRQQKFRDAAALLRKAQNLRPKDNIQQFLEKVEEAALRSTRSS